MASPNTSAVAFSMPGGEKCVPSRSRPVDLVHLARQTMGDRALEQEVVSMFLQQAVSVSEKIASADEDRRKFLAHGLKGSARGIGAFGVAEIAEKVEADPSNKALLKKLAQRIGAVREFIAAINR